MVSVVDGTTQESTPAVDQAKIDAPRIDPDRSDAARPPQSVENLDEKPRGVPHQGAIELDRPIWKTVCLHDGQAIVVEEPTNDPTAFRADVHGR
jgi:hypothetical protein